MTNVAIIGASGLVGQCLTEILADKLDCCKLSLFGKTSVGQKVCHFGKTYTIKNLQSLLRDAPPSFAMFMASDDVAKEFVPKLAQLGTVCIDNSAFFRMHGDVPLVVPQINGEKIAFNKIVANPNCTTIQVAVALNALKSLQPCEITVATYQSASGAGKDGLCDLEEKRTYGKLKCFRHPISDNLIPQIGKIQPDGTTSEEQKLKNELRKILDLPQLFVNAFCVRVPVSIGHGAFVNVRFEKKFSLENVRQLLQNEPNVLIFDDVEKEIFPMPSLVRHTHYVGVGRLHTDGHGGLNMFVAADNLLVGAAYNAYEILKTAMKNSVL